jgi:hypothetical protein
MTCPNGNLFQDWTTPIEVISGVPFEDVMPYFQIDAIDPDTGVRTGIDLTDATATLTLVDSKNVAQLALASADDELTLNADTTDGKIVTITTGAMITAMAPFGNHGSWELAVFDVDGHLVAGIQGTFKYRRRITA